eukprot:CAMPEP_0179216660 /NCGR_PEP_ID=MMETSP0797-20121207/3498_1 /TAXON_ID=47934 /ORGANISM="Dinophysis acuminata, Strain DAEP01" /LENGTH=315 /DNA_ID=CAMNT_0020922835 /DNA_START=216 /DNA_END=1161 /DNA_ORIENTATION=-
MARPSSGTEPRGNMQWNEFAFEFAVAGMFTDMADHRPASRRSGPRAAKARACARRAAVPPHLPCARGLEGPEGAVGKLHDVMAVILGFSGGALPLAPALLPSHVVPLALLPLLPAPLQLANVAQMAELAQGAVVAALRTVQERAGLAFAKAVAERPHALRPQGCGIQCTTASNRARPRRRSLAQCQRLYMRAPAGASGLLRPAGARGGGGAADGLLVPARARGLRAGRGRRPDAPLRQEPLHEQGLAYRAADEGLLHAPGHGVGRALVAAGAVPVRTRAAADISSELPRGVSPARAHGVGGRITGAPCISTRRVR